MNGCGHSHSYSWISPRWSTQGHWTQHCISGTSLLCHSQKSWSSQIRLQDEAQEVRWWGHYYKQRAFNLVFLHHLETRSWKKEVGWDGKWLEGSWACGLLGSWEWMFCAGYMSGFNVWKVIRLNTWGLSSFLYVCYSPIRSFFKCCRTPAFNE